MRRLALLFAALLACGLIAAGCGDDNNDDSAATTESAPVDTTPGVDTTPEKGTITDDTTSGSDQTPDSVDEAIQVCKDNVQSSAGGLSEGLRSDLEDLCEKAANEDDVRDASQEICKRIVEETVPEGSRDEALAICDSSEP